MLKLVPLNRALLIHPQAEACGKGTLNLSPTGFSLRGMVRMMYIRF